MKKIKSKQIVVIAGLGLLGFFLMNGNKEALGEGGSSIDDIITKKSTITYSGEGSPSGGGGDITVNFPEQTGADMGLISAFLGKKSYSGGNSGQVSSWPVKSGWKYFSLYQDPTENLPNALNLKGEDVFIDSAGVEHLPNLSTDKGPAYVAPPVITKKEELANG